MSDFKVKMHQIRFRLGMRPSTGADFLGALGANAPREKTVVGAVHPEEFRP